MTSHPILWTFRRCPYAIRARVALNLANQTVEQREVVLRDKPDAFLQTSASGTVPTLDLGVRVIDESLEIMIWALEQDDPEGLLDMPDEGWDLIRANDGPFKAALDHTKYTTRYPHLNMAEERAKASAYLIQLDQRLSGQTWLFGARPTIADFALLPFVRQFAFIDRPWFDAQDWPALIVWLDRFLASAVFADVMVKRSQWVDGQIPVLSVEECSQIN
ncbi:MAG: glutathione S-transferase [Paracoccaceae bacterium]